MSSDAKATFERDASAAASAPGAGRLDEFARRYYAPLLSFFRKRTRGTPEVQDLVQQVFLRLAQYRALDNIQNPDVYIFQIAANTLKDYYRYSSVRERHKGEYRERSDDEGSDLSPERVLQGRQAVAQLALGLRQLPARTRSVIMLRTFEGLKNAEIARLQGISVRAVEKHMAKALAHLSRVLERDVAEGDS